MKSLRRIQIVDVLEGRGPTSGEPYVFDWRSYDIPETVCAGIRNAAPGLVAVILAFVPLVTYVRAIERAARRRGVRVIWCKRPMPGEVT